jgi:Cu+-exporting ATPase
MVEGKTVAIGNLRLVKKVTELTEQELSSFEKEMERLEAMAKTVMLIGKVEGLIAVADTVKEESKEAVKALQNMGISVTMLTGDNRRTAEAISK